MSSKCTRPVKGWRCLLSAHEGPCLTKPEWWNVIGQRQLRSAYRTQSA